MKILGQLDVGFWTWLAHLVVMVALVAVGVLAAYLLLRRMPQSHQAWLAEAFSEGGKASFSRLSTGLALAFCLVLDAYLTVKNHAFPSDALTGQAMLVGVLYGLNQAGTAARAFAGAPAAKKDGQ